VKKKVNLITICLIFSLFIGGCKKEPQLFKFYFQDNAKSVRGNLTLNQSYQEQTILWKSSNPSIIEIVDYGSGRIYGVVTQGESDQKVTLQAIIDNKTYTYKLTVKALTDDEFYNFYPAVKDLNHVFKILTYEDTLELFSSGTHLLYLGFPPCPWCIEYVYYYNLVAKNLGVEVINYYDMRSIRQIELIAGEMRLNLEFQALIDLISAEHLSQIERDDKVYDWLFAPSLLLISNGEVIGSLNGGFKDHIATEATLNKQQEKEFKSELEKLFKKYLNALK
jgi:hypothetical protein